ncbi:MAG: penicillin-binding protein 2 [Anaerolineae bacterium]|nr:penicillin-binding protein 2 [Anaerolineae bacterium]
MPAHLRRRLSFVSTLLIGAAIALALRLVSVQIVQGAELRAQAEAARENRLRIPEPPRGMIYDRDGFLLTVNELHYSVEAHPPFIRNVDLAARRLAPILHVPAASIATVLSGEASWVCLDPLVTAQEGEAIQELGLQGIVVERRWLRHYPHHTLTSHLLGFVNRNGVGFYGLEGRYDPILQARTPQWQGETGPSARWPLPHEEGTVDPPLAGTDLVLTFDLGVQAMVAGELERALNEFQAAGGTIIVLDPNTGAILAMVTQPAYDPNHYERYVYQEREQDFLSPAYGAQYEPGSVFKIITLAAALESGHVTPQTTYYDAGRIEYGGRVFRNWDENAYGEQGLVGLLGHSLNVGAVWLATQMGPDDFYHYLQAFGVGQPTGVDLQGEAVGWLRVPGDLEWHDSDLGANSFGQGLAMTPLQVVSAVAAVANEGRLMRPYVVAQQVRPDGTVLDSQPVVRGQPISAETAATLTELLAQALEQHLPQTQVAGYRIAGKTSTAQIPVPGGYDPRWTIASFVGYGPVRDPQLVILVRLDRPQTSPWGSQTAAIVFQRLATQLFPMLGIAPDE